MKNTHPTLYRLYWIYAVLSIGLGLNFLFLHPTFDPLNIPKWAIGAVFLGCGVLKAALLLRGARPLRLSMMLSVAIMTFWAAALTAEFFLRHQTSMQLPLTFIGLAAAATVVLTEPFVNPATEKA